MEERQTGDVYSTATLVTLQPFVHQVGGHSSIQQFDQYTVCKPLFSKELRFYEEVSPAFKPFIPEFKGKSRCCLCIFTGKMLTTSCLFRMLEIFLCLERLLNGLPIVNLHLKIQIRTERS